MPTEKKAMTPEKREALDYAIQAAGNQINLCRHLNVAQSSFWTWHKGNGPSPAIVPKMVELVSGERTADEFRPDVYGWLAPMNNYLDGRNDMPDSARIAAIDLTWHQIDRNAALDYLTRQRGWSRAKAKRAIDHIDRQEQKRQARGTTAA